jgi:putative flavoprotein involved in K+ transport
VEPNVENGPANDEREIVRDWLGKFESALAARDEAAIARLLAPAATYRDLLVLWWDFRNVIGRADIASTLAAASRAGDVRDLAVRDGSSPQRVAAPDGGQEITAFVQFRTDVGRGDGFLRLVQGAAGRWLLAALVAELVELDGHPWQVGEHRPAGKEHGPVAGRVPWNVTPDPEFADVDPQVVIVGAGHNGLALAARLGCLGVSALVLERNARVGDNWRNRYPSLALHDPVGADHLPYLPLPGSWPNFTPASKFGDYLECYATMMDITVWCNTNAESARPDEATGRWTLEAVRADGSRRTLRPHHLVMATGYNDVPRIPKIAGADRFGGTLTHSAYFTGGHDWSGKRAVVVGTGVSGHDVAQDLWEHGAEVTMLQRGATYVINAGTFHQFFFPNYLPGGPRTEDADLMGALMPFSQFPALGPGMVQAAAQIDRELLDGLETAGFKLGWGPDGQGVPGLAFRESRTGYYYNIGASDLIAKGEIAVRQAGIEYLTESGVRLTDGTDLQAELLVFATGYKSVRESCRSLLGDVVDTLPEICHVGFDGEFTGVWRQSGWERLWFMVSTGIFFSRFYSSHLALQLKAIEEGLMPVSGVRDAS